MRKIFLKNWKTVMILFCVGLLSILTINCSSGGGGGGDDDDGNPPMLEGTYEYIINLGELTMTITDSQSPCVFVGDKLFYEVVSITETTLILLEDGDDVDTYTRISEPALGLVGKWHSEDDPGETVTINEDKTWEFYGKVDGDGC